MGALLMAMTLNFSACGNGGGNGDEEINVLYQTEGEKKTDGIFNTDELFSVRPTTKKADIEYGALTGLSAFKFESVAYEKENLSSTWVFAVMGLPNEAKFPKPQNGYPAVVLVHGGGGQVYTEWIQWWNARGYAAIAFDTYGNELDEMGIRVKNEEGGPGSTDGPLADKSEDYKNSWVYHNVINIIYCNNILRNRDEIDEERICATGISWGSVLCEIASGVDNRFACFAPVYGSGFIADDANWQKEAGKYGGSAFDNGNVETWEKYFDPLSYISYCYKPILFVSGIDDPCFSTVARAKTYSLAKGQTFYAQHYNLGHGHVWYKTPEIYYFFNHVLYGAEYGIVNHRSDIDEEVFETAENSYSSARIIYTRSVDENSHDWIWESMEVGGEKGEIRFSVPDGITAFFVEFSHAEDEYYKTSTEIIINKDISLFR